MRKIVSLLLIAVFLIVPVSAASSSSSNVEYVQKSSFWTWLAGKDFPLNRVIGSTFGASCPNSEDGYHHASSYKRPEASWSGPTGYYKCICDLCGAEFKAYEQDLQQSYDAQVAELPARDISSSGHLLWQVFSSDLLDSSYFTFREGGSPRGFYLNDLPRDVSTNYYKYKSVLNPSHVLLQYLEDTSGWLPYFSSSIRSVVPISGSYRRVESDAISYSIVFSDGNIEKGTESFSESKVFSHFSVGDEIFASSSFKIEIRMSTANVCFYFPI